MSNAPSMNGRRSVSEACKPISSARLRLLVDRDAEAHTVGFRGVEGLGRAQVFHGQPCHHATKAGANWAVERCGFGTKAANSFSLLRFSVRGERCAALRCYPYDWQIFAYLEDDQFPEVQRPVRLGTTTEEPTTEEVEKLLAAQPAFKFTKNIRRLNRR